MNRGINLKIEIRRLSLSTPRSITLNTELEHLQQLILKHQSNLQYLEEQAAQYGAGAVPLELHNRLLAERERLQELNRQLEKLQDLQLTTSRLAPIKPVQDGPLVLIVESEKAWQEIVVGIAQSLGCKTRVFTQPHEINPADYNLSVISLPASQTLKTEDALQAWLEVVIACGKNAPLILLSAQNTLSVSNSVRQTLLKNNIQAIATIPKETFSHDWFIKMFNKGLGLVARPQDD